MIDVLVIGGGNAALCAALMAREAGASVMLLESAPRQWRGGNSVHTRNLRCMHEAPQDVLTSAYPEEEYWQDLYKITGGLTDEHLARIALRESSRCRPWMQKHGVQFQGSLSGTLHLSRTNAFFLGGGKALVNAYYRSAQAMGVQIRYGASVTGLELRSIDGNGADGAGSTGTGMAFVAAMVQTGSELEGFKQERIEAKTCVVAAGGFESNREWLREAWGVNEHGEHPSDQFLIRGTRFNQGAVLKALLDAGADRVSNPSAAHMVAIDARAPLYDGGIATRVDCVGLGIVVNGAGDRFYDEGEDFWPKRYALWGRFVAAQKGQTAYCLTDSKPIGRFMPPVFPGEQASSVAELAAKLGLDPAKVEATVSKYNAACSVQPANGSKGTFNHTVLDDCVTHGLQPPKTHWALPLDQPPFFGFALKPGVTFTYLGVKIDDQTRVHFGGHASPNLFAAGEVMAGNVLGKGYLAGIGMTIGTAFGRIAGRQAAQQASLTQQQSHLL